MTLDCPAACTTCKTAVAIHFKGNMTWNRACSQDIEEEKNELDLDEGEEGLWPAHPCHYDSNCETWLK